ncbi:DMT family transporter [Frigidibacter sp. RF13]|uniref:DMT family transporter n=1 Tax=Frigidibacter sp. RF13 TaxID=2997340 RepID=UPI00227067CF|nr:DMT family transporter [Frigidibacter sp. RF13]MCY1127979.1 DMT family transporter [Frigidibacter sp. RF13]
MSRRPVWLLAAPVIFLILWSAGFSVAKIGLRHSGPFTLLALRYLLAVAILLPLLPLVRPPLPRGRAALDIAVTGFLIQVAYFGLCYIAFRSGVSAGGVAIIVCLQPILVGLIAPSFVGERVSLMRWLGLGLGLAGALTVIIARSGISAEPPLGLLAAVGGLLGITGGTLYEKRFGAPQHPIPANLIQYGVGALFTLPVAVLAEGLHADWTGELAAVLFYLVIGNSLVSMTLLLAMIRAGEVARVSSLFYLVPPLSALFAWPLLGEALPLAGWLGMALAATGVALARR